MQLSKKQKAFSQFFAAFLKFTFHFNSFLKMIFRNDFHSLCFFRNYRLQKPWLDKCLKRRLSVHPSSVNMLNGPKNL